VGVIGGEEIIKHKGYQKMKKGMTFFRPPIMTDEERIMLGKLISLKEIEEYSKGMQMGG